jgi:hypothetical protein
LNRSEEIFDRACREWGIGARTTSPLRDRTLFKNCLESGHGWIESIRSLEFVKDFGEIHFDLVDNSALNAVASLREGIGIIAVTTGAILFPRDFFSRLLSHPGVLPQIGNPCLETVRPCHSEPIIRDFAKVIVDRVSAGREMLPDLPNDSVRRHFADFVTQIVYNVLITHEIAHIVNGHLGYLHESYGLSDILEMGTHLSPAIFNPLTRQVLEMDADSIAVANSLNVVAIAETPKEFGTGFDTLISAPEHAAYAWQFAVTALFYLLGLSSDLTNAPRAFYPPTGMRYTLCLANAHGLLKRRNPNLAEKFKPVLASVTKDFWQGVGRIGDSTSREDLLSYGSDLVGEGARGHVKTLNSHWDRIRPDLLRFSYNERLPMTEPY